VTQRGHDPRAVVLAALVAAFAVAAAPGGRLLVALPLVPALGIVAGLDARRWRALLRSVLVLWVLSFLANAWLVPGTRWGPAELGWARPTVEGMRAGLGHGARLVLLAALGVWSAALVEPLDLARSLEWSVRRRRRARRRVHRSLVPVVLAAGMLPLFLEEARRLADVDRLRGGRGGLRAAARLAPLWLTLVVERADALALALTLRGYRPDGPERGFARAYRLGPADAMVLAASAVLAVFLLRP
jgi:energy-coupling factor transporter transmembrane protein EcfT